MTEHLHRDLEQIKQHVLSMGGLVEEALRSACVAFTHRDESRTEDLQELEERIDQMQLEIDDEILKVLALHQPVATDLRFVTAAMKIVNDLERIGDLSGNIADRLLQMVRAPELGEPVALELMMQHAGEMLGDALNAFVRGDSTLARAVLDRDDEVDRLNRRHFEILIERMKRDPEAVETAVAMLSISRNVERVADLATNIAEDVVFVVEAVDIRHR
jgi:phosphate transport system protein